jgi:hypothetical protein
MKNKIRIATVIPDGYESNNRIYSGGGIARTCTARDWKDSPKILIRRANDELKCDRNSISTPR